MKLRVMAAVAAGAVASLMVSALSTVSADGSDAATAASINTSLPTTAPPFTLLPDLCVGLPRNTVLSSCPAPCAQDAPCVVYDQNANFTKLTGCDYGKASTESFCTRAKKQAQTCEIHCFAPTPTAGAFAMQIKFNVTPLGKTARRNKVENFDGGLGFFAFSYQLNNFISAIGRLEISENVHELYLAGDYGSGINLGGGPPDTRFVQVDVDPKVLQSAPSLKTITLKDLPLGDDRAAQILSHAPSSVIELSATRVNLTTLSVYMFGTMPEMETLTLSNNAIAFVSPMMITLPKLRTLDLSSNAIETFNIDAPSLETILLSDNRLVRIPQIVFTLPNLSSLSLDRNLIAKPLVLSEEQFTFLEALFSISIDLVSPPDTSRPEDDLSQYLVNATTQYLSQDPTLPVLVVSSENAQIYNDLLEQRAYPGASDGIVAPPASPTPAPPTSLPPYVPPDPCQGLERKTLYANHVDRCAKGGVYVLYDQDDSLNQATGCDFDVASPTSYCTNFVRIALTCEFQCFAAYDDPSAFKFAVPFKTELGSKIPRRSFDDEGFHGAKTADVPFLSDTFVDAVGSLNLSSTVTDVSISGGRIEMGTRGRVVDVSVSSSLLSKMPQVMSLSLTNIGLSTTSLAGILASSPATLKSLNLRNTLLTALPEGGFARLQQLETLTLSQNELTSVVAEELALPKLRNLYLSDNALTTVAVQAPNLATLDLSGNSLVRIPPAIFSLSKLDALNLLNNPIALPLVVSQIELDFLASVVGLKLPQSTSTSPPATKSPEDRVVVDGTEKPATDGSELLVDGKAAVLGGTSVIVVSQTNADLYNGLLQQAQNTVSAQKKSASPGPSSGPAAEGEATDGPASINSDAADTSMPDSSSSVNGAANILTISSSGSSGVHSQDVGAPSGASTKTPSADNTSTTSKSNDSSVTMLLVFSGLGSALLVLIILLCVFIRRRRREKNANEPGDQAYAALDDKADEGSSKVTATSNGELVRWWADDDMRSHRLRSADISDKRVVGGSSGSGIVWLVDYRGGSQQLVSKRLIQSEGPAHEARLLDLFTEAKMASTLSHPSVVPFVGVAWTNKTDLQVLYEYMPNGDLGSYLARSDPSTLPWLPEKLQLAIDIIEALVYTHSFNPPLLHRDLKASNVLLDDNFKAKLGDFGSARLESESNTMTTSEIGTGRWLAPEILLGSTSYGTPSDIYSFGVVLCELDTHQVPYAAETMDEATLLQRVARGELRPSMSESCPLEIREIAESCLVFDPASRPNAMQLAYMLRSLRPRDDQQL